MASELSRLIDDELAKVESESRDSEKKAQRVPLHIKSPSQQERPFTWRQKQWWTWKKIASAVVAGVLFLAIISVLFSRSSSQDASGVLSSQLQQSASSNDSSSASESLDSEWTPDTENGNKPSGSDTDLATIQHLSPEPSSSAIPEHTRTHNSIDAEEPNGSVSAPLSENAESPSRTESAESPAAEGLEGLLPPAPASEEGSAYQPSLHPIDADLIAEAPKIGSVVVSSPDSSIKNVSEADPPGQQVKFGQLGIIGRRLQFM